MARDGNQKDEEEDLTKAEKRKKRKLMRAWLS